MKLYKRHILLFSLFCTFLNAQNVDRKFISLNKNSTHVEITTNDGVYHIKPYSNKIIETSFIPNGESFNPNSHAVVLKPENLDFLVQNKDNSITVSTSGLSVQITKIPFKISYHFRGNPLVSERMGYIRNEDNEVLDFNITSDEVLYGGGARALGMNRRGNRLKLYNRAHYG